MESCTGISGFSWRHFDTSWDLLLSDVFLSALMIANFSAILRLHLPRVWHTGLLHKLSLLGLNTSSIDWLNNYLSDRVLHVRVGSALSQTFPLLAGVAQGSHLGPVLFLAFINNLPATVPISSELYADDALLHQHCSADNSLKRLQ